MAKTQIVNIILKQNWDDISGVLETTRSEVKTVIWKDGITFSGCDRFGEKTDHYITLDKESMILLKKIIEVFI